MEKLYTLKEAAALTGTPVETYRTQLNRGHIKGVKDGKVWKLPESVLTLKAVVQAGNPYDALFHDWKAEQASGLHTGKPIGHRAIDNNEAGLKLFWKKLEKEPDLELITPENLGIATTSYEVNYETRQCYYSSKDMIYKAVISFCKLMIRRGLMPEYLMPEFKKRKPKRVFPPRKTVLEEDAFQRFIAANQKLEGGRSEFDVVLGNVLIGLMAYAGLRRDEVIHLGLSNVDLQNGFIRIIHAKGHKPRIVGINEQLDGYLRTWLKHRPKSDSTRLLLQATGEPITKWVVQNRIYRLAKSNGFDITAHGLRRTFATHNSNKGIPLDMLRLTLGHNKLETTQGYLLTDEMAAAAAIRGNYKARTFEQAKAAKLNEARQKLTQR